MSRVLLKVPMYCALWHLRIPHYLHFAPRLSNEILSEEVKGKLIAQCLSLKLHLFNATWQPTTAAVVECCNRAKVNSMQRRRVSRIPGTINLLDFMSAGKVLHSRPVNCSFLCSQTHASFVPPPRHEMIASILGLHFTVEHFINENARV
jgi:hypothetical protein